MLPFEFYQVLKHLQEMTMPGTPQPPFVRHPAVESFAEEVRRQAARKAQPSHRLHPLHSIESIVNYTRNTGEYFDRERCTGRSTILALEAIVKALKTPHVAVPIRDHFDNRYTHADLVKTAQDMAAKLGLKHLEFSTSALTVRFTNS